MPYNSVMDARSKVPTLKDLSDSQVKVFMSVYDSETKKGTKESEAIPIAIGAAKKIDKQLKSLENTINFEYYETECNISIDKGKTSDVTRDDKGNLEYRGEKFVGYGKPMRESGGKQGKVLVKEGDTVKVVRFGDPSLRDNYSNEANDRFYDRFGGRPQIKDKMSPLYWSARWLWPRGSMKGKGAKPFYTLKKSEYYMDENDNTRSAMIHFLKGMMEFIRPPEKTQVDIEDFIESNDIEVSEDSLGSVVIKAFDDEKMISYDPLYINVGESDAHGDGITEKELDKLINNINRKISEGTLKSKIHHTYDTKGFHFLKASRMPMDAYIENPLAEEGRIMIEEGQPILKTQFTDPLMWKKKKQGELKNPSIGGSGKKIDNPDYEGD